MPPRAYPEESRALLSGRPEVRESVTKAALHFHRNRARAYAEVPVEDWRGGPRTPTGSSGRS